MQQNTLYTRIGGREAIQAAVAKMYEKILDDRILQPFFKDVDISTLRRSQTAFIVMAFGGPHNYTGQGLREAHQKYVDQGLSDLHFDAVATHLGAALSELGVEKSLIDEVMHIVGSTRNDVLCKVV